MKKDNSYCRDEREHIENIKIEEERKQGLYRFSIEKVSDSMWIDFIKRNRFPTRENIRNEKYDVEAKMEGCTIYDYKMFHKNRMNEILILISCMGLMFLAGLLCGAL